MAFRSTRFSLPAAGFVPLHLLARLPLLFPPTGLPCFTKRVADFFRHPSGAAFAPPWSKMDESWPISGTTFGNARAAEAGGSPCTSIMEGGVFEKAGVNFSEVFGQMPEDLATQLPGEGRDFTATGLSLVLHPRNPMVPTVHANFRYLTKGGKKWFGGGSDLTHLLSLPRGRRSLPSHLEGCLFQARAACRLRAHSSNGCDEYFFSAAIAAKPRGVGGIFFTTTRSKGTTIVSLFAFVRDSAARRSWTPTYRFAAPPQNWSLLMITTTAAFRSFAPRAAYVRIQPDLRPRHAVRPQDQRADRIDPTMSLPPVARLVV